MSERLRLLYFAGKYFPGSMGIAMHRELLDALADHAIEATIVSLGQPRQRPVVQATVEEGRRVVRFATVASPADRLLNAVSKRLLHYDFFLSGTRRLADVLRREPFDIVQGNMAFPFGAMAAAALDLARRPAPLLLNLAGGDLIDSSEARYGYARFGSVRRVLRYAFGRAAVVRTNSAIMVERAVALGCPPQRVHVVPSNITSLMLPPAPVPEFRTASRARLRAAHDLPDGPLLVAVGRLSPIKGYDWLVRALPPLVARWPGLTAVIAGPTVAGEERYAASLQVEAARLGVGRNLHLIGAVPQEALRDLYAAADLLLVTSLFEGLNKTGIEAGASGTPTVVTETTGLAAHITDYAAGVTIPPRDPAALAVAVADLLDDPARWAACSAAAQRMAADFSPAGIARALLPLYAIAAPPGHPWCARHATSAAPATTARGVL
jgi:glycosyltransferase involved in cell wall biosynthesis